MTETEAPFHYTNGRAAAFQNFNQECSAVLNKTSLYNGNNRRAKNLVACALEKAWIKFAAQHQKSPSHVNNNVQGCTRHRRNGVKAPTPPSSQCTDNDKGYLPANQMPSKINQKYFHYRRLHVLVRMLLKLIEIASIILTFLVLLYGIVAFHKPTQSLISRNTQDLIYPIMRRIRLTALPFVRRFPFLTDFYEESCLISNPYYFHMNNMDCWPCETVRHVVDLTGFSNFSSAYHDSGIPFVVKDAFNAGVNISDLRKLYFRNLHTMSQVGFDSNVQDLTSFQELFDSGNQDKLMRRNDIHISWKINRVVITRLLRKYFPKPYFIPKATEVSIQHFLYLDGRKSKSYPLPLTEFANVFVTQVSGSRYVALIPRENCHRECKVVSTLLQPNDVLFYNWLFWRPRSVPVDSEFTNSNSNVSITYVGSFY